MESFHVHKSCYPADMRRGKQVRCSDCSYMGSDLQSVRQHFRTKHVPKMFTCIVPVTSSAVCGEKYATKQLVMNHVEKHFRHMQGDTGKTRKRKKRTAAACETETDDSSDDSDECEVPSQKSERIPVSTKSSVPATTNTRPPAVADTQPQNDLLRISINELLDRLSHCSDCNGYFVTKEDLLQHYFAHTQVPDDGSTDSDVDAKQEPESVFRILILSLNSFQVWNISHLSHWTKVPFKSLMKDRPYYSC